MSIFKKTIKHSKPSNNLDKKIKNLEEGLKKTKVVSEDGMLPSIPKICDEFLVEKKEDERYNWRESFLQESLTEEVLRDVKEDKEKNSLVKVERYISESNQELINLRNQIFAEISEDTLLNLPEIKNKISKVLQIYDQLQEGLLNEPPQVKNEDPLTPLNQNFVTPEELNKHYTLFINRIQEQLSTIGGGGETQLKYLDDIVGIATNASAYDGKFLKYDHSIKQFVFETVSAGGGGSSDYASVAGIATYALSAGIATYSDFSGYATASGIATYSDFSGYATASGIATYSDFSGYATASGIATYSDFSGYATASGIATYSDYAGISTYSDYALISGIATSVIGGVGSISELAVSGIATFNSDAQVDGRLKLNYLQYEDDSAIVDFFYVAPDNHIVTAASDWTLKLKSRASGANEGHLWLESGQNTAVKVNGSGSNVQIVPSDGGTSSTWTFYNNNRIQFPDSTIQTTAFTGYANVAGISTTSQGLTGTPNIVVGVSTAGLVTTRNIFATGISTFVGVSSFRGNVNLLDNRKLYFGNKNDIEIYSNGSSGIYRQNNAGTTYHLGTNIQFANTTATLDYAIFSSSGISLNYNGQQRLVTTDGGVSVANTVTSDGLNVNYIGTINELRTKSVAEKTTLIDGNAIELTFNTGGGNVAICTNPSGDITLNVNEIPTDDTFDNYSISFSVVVTQTGTSRTCTAVNLNGVSKVIQWSGGSLENALSGMSTSIGYDIFTFTGINTVGSASTTENYVVLGAVKGGFA